jgi:2-polyprenyl-6-methoxyphenol hydroxylase-like FAD-dependent oxidoreductase
MVAQDEAYGYSLTRRRLDPALRMLAADTPGVELLAGWTATGLRGGRRPSGLEIATADGEHRTLEARLIVAADGRDSGLARLAGVRARVKPNGRFFYWAYWRGLKPDGPRSRTWLLEPDCAYTFPNEDGLTLALVAPHVDRAPDFRADHDGAYLRMVRSLPDGPDLSAASRESKVLGKLNLMNKMRPAARPGIAFVGDAAMASDPFWGVGCGWAFQSAEWLVEETGADLVEGRDLEDALGRYRRRHLRSLGPHHAQITEFASGRPANLFERALFRAGARDQEVMRRFEQVSSRRRPPTALISPASLLRVLRAALGPA